MIKHPKGRRCISCQSGDPAGHDVWLSIPESRRREIRVFLDGEEVDWLDWQAACEFARYVRYVKVENGKNVERFGSVRIVLPEGL